MEPKTRILDADGNEVDINSLDRDELLVLRGRLEDKNIAIKTQIDQAKTGASAEGVYADRDWFVSATTAMRFTGRSLQRIQERLGFLSRERKAQNIAMKSVVVRDEHLAFLHAFFKVAKAELEPEDFQEICTSAIAMKHDQTCEMCSLAEVAR